MTDTRDTAPISYAAGLQRLALYAEYVSRERLIDLYNDNLFPLAPFGAEGMAGVEAARRAAETDAAMARALAGLVQRAQEHLAPYPPDSLRFVLENDESPAGDGLRLISALSTGFTPRPPAGEEGKDHG